MITFVFLDSETGAQFARLNDSLVRVVARRTAKSKIKYLSNGGEMHTDCRIIRRLWTVDESSPESMSDEAGRANASF